MYSDEKRPENIVQVYEVVPRLEALQPERKRPLWQKILAGVLFICALFVFREFFTCTKTHFQNNYSVDYTPDMTVVDDDTFTSLFNEATSNRPDKIRREKFEFAKEIKAFRFAQINQNVLPTYTQVLGRVFLKSDSKVDHITVYAVVKASNDDLVEKVKFDKSYSELDFAADVLSTSKGFVNVTAFIVFPKSEEYYLRALDIHTHGLNIDVMDSFRTKVKATYFQTSTGHVISHAKERADVFHTPSLAIQSFKGNVYGRYGLGEYAHIETNKGSIGVNMTIDESQNKTMRLSTFTWSGRNKVQFANDLGHRKLLTSHRSVSGLVHVGYPDDWEGKFFMVSGSGKLKFVGQGTKLVDSGTNDKGKFYVVEKGKGYNQGDFESVSGNVDVGVGRYNWH